MKRRFLLFLLWALVAGCKPQEYADKADTDAYGALSKAHEQAMGRPAPFDVRYHPLEATTQPTSAAVDPIQIGNKMIPIGGEGKEVVITLDEALQIAFRNSRSYQDQRETLYITALAVANTRRAWSWAGWGGGSPGTAGYNHNDASPDPTVNGNSGSTTPKAEFANKLMSGGQLALGSGLALATDTSGLGSFGMNSLLNANITQPLLRGAWRDIAYEVQYRAERDLIFAVYSYQRLTQTFATGIITQYYGVLQQRDLLENERSNIARLKETLAMTKILVQGQQVSPIEQDQAEQNLLDAQVRLQNDEQAYFDALDHFKVQLGLPLMARAELDYPGALEGLRKQGPRVVPLDNEKAVTMAMQTRPDVLTQAAKVRDADRDVVLAADMFNPQIDVVAGAGGTSTPKGQPQNLDFGNHTRNAGLKLDYELDQTDHRDAYRKAMLGADKARRDLAEFTDNVRLEVRQRYRQLQQSRQSYELQQRSVQIATRRRKLASLQLKNNLASARDVLEAEEALRNAQNGLMSALISYTTTRLEFLASLGMIDVDEKGAVHERTEAVLFNRIQGQYPYVATSRPATP